MLNTYRSFHKGRAKAFPGGFYLPARFPAGLLSVLLCLSCFASTSVAQTLEEVVVTAERRAVSSQDIAVSVTAFNGDTLDDFGIDDFAGYAARVPGLSGQIFEGSVQNRGPRTLGLRGVQTINLTFFGGQNTVGFYINDTPIPVANPRLVDLERIEVLRGPQGTLYGATSLGGTVRLITRQPEFDRPSGYFRLDQSYASHGGYNAGLEGWFNAPVNEQIAVRATGYYEDMDGYIDFAGIDPFNMPTGEQIDDANDNSAAGGTFAVAFAPTEDLTITPTVYYSKRETDMADFFNEPDFVQVNHFLQPGSDEFTMVDLNIEWNTRSGVLTSTTGYFDMESEALRDVTDFLGAFASPAPAYIPFDTSIDQTVFVTETRFVSALEGPMQFVTGVFYADWEELSGSTTYGEGVDSVFGFPVVDGNILTISSPRNRDELAVFGELSYELAERWTLVGGLRWFDQEYDSEDITSGTFAFPPTEKGTGSESGTVLKGRVEFRPGDSSLLYGSIAEGFRMGGANIPLPSFCDQAVEDFFGQPNAPSQYDSDSLTSYEMGGKTSAASGRVQFSGAAYYIDWDEPQIPVTLIGCPFSGLSTNAGAVENWGFEFEMSAAPLDQWQLWFGAAYTNAEVADTLGFPGATVVIAQGGEKMPDIPEWTFSLMSNYDFPLNDRWDGFFLADYSYMSDRPADFSSVTTIRRDEVNLANLRLGASNRDGWNVSLFISNLLDDDPSLGPYTFGNTAGGGGRFNDYTLRPRTYGLSIGKSFE